MLKNALLEFRFLKKAVSRQKKRVSRQNIWPNFVTRIFSFQK